MRPELKNSDFFEKNKQAESAVKEAVGLVNDIIEYVHLFLKSLKNYSYHAFPVAMIHVAMPLSYGIFCNLMIGNLPTCYFQTRIILEGLVESLIADARFPECSFFETKLDCLEHVRAEMHLSFPRICRLLLPRTIRGKDAEHIIDLWRNLSEKWLHARGVVKKMVNKIVKEEKAPPWSIIIPVPYDDNDISDILEFTEHIRVFRKTVRKLVSAWSSLFIQHKV